MRGPTFVVLSASCAAVVLLVMATAPGMALILMLTFAASAISAKIRPLIAMVVAFAGIPTAFQASAGLTSTGDVGRPYGDVASAAAGGCCFQGHVPLTRADDWYQAIAGIGSMAIWLGLVILCAYGLPSLAGLIGSVLHNLIGVGVGLFAIVLFVPYSLVGVNYFRGMPGLYYDVQPLTYRLVVMAVLILLVTAWRPLRDRIRTLAHDLRGGRDSESLLRQVDVLASTSYAFALQVFAAGFGWFAVARPSAVPSLVWPAILLLAAAALAAVVPRLTKFVANRLSFIARSPAASLAFAATSVLAGTALVFAVDGRGANEPSELWRGGVLLAASALVASVGLSVLAQSVRGEDTGGVG